MLVLQKCFSLTHSSRTLVTVRRLCRCCCCGRSSLSGLSSGFCFPTTPSTRTALLPSQDRCSFHRLLPADRYEPRFSDFRGFTTSPTTRSEAVEQIQSTHYHLVYTCKVAESFSSNNLIYFCVFEFLTCRLLSVCRFALPDPRRRSLNWLTTKVWL